MTNIDWFQNYSDDPRVMAGGERAWDLQSSANLKILTTGLYLYSVKDIASGKLQAGKLVIAKNNLTLMNKAINNILKQGLLANACYANKC